MQIPKNKEYDFVIVGSGMGGLACAYILTEAGHSVIVLERNVQLGGNLQVFSRDKSVLDTGVHYIGGVDEGQNLNQFFKYFGLLDKLKLKRLDDDCFDLIRFGDGKSYKYGQGYENFKKNLISDFPEEEKAIEAYCEKIIQVCKKFPLYNLETEGLGDYFTQMEYRDENAFQYITSITQNERLRNVLAGNNPLYAGVREKTPFYVHALILNSYIMGSYRVVDGGSHIAIHMAKEIRKAGGEIYSRKQVVSANYNEEGLITEVVLQTGETVKGKNFISNVHPAATIDIFGDDRFLPAYKKRIRGLQSTLSAFALHVVFHKNSFPYLNYNIYQYFVDDVWSGVDYKTDNWPEGFFACTPATSKSSEFADSMSILTYMNFSETEKWKDTYNTTASTSFRGKDYDDFKKEKETQILARLEEVFPGIGSKIKSVHSSTPLTIRDYIGDHDGSMYGILKDNNNTARTIINPKTKIKNLFLTGQNIMLHGVLGVTVGAFVTCFEFVDKKEIIRKVKNA